MKFGIHGIGFGSMTGYLLERVLIVKPKRGGPAMWRWIVKFLRVGRYRVYRVVLTSKKSFYVFPLEAFEALPEESFFSLASGKLMLLYVDRGILDIESSAIEEIDLEVKLVRKGPLKIKVPVVNGKVIEIEPRFRR